MSRRVDSMGALAGAALIVAGVARWSVSAGLVVAGMFLLAGSLWRVR